MTARRLGLLALIVTLGAPGALISGVIFVAAELALIGTLVLERLSRLERRLD